MTTEAAIGKAVHAAVGLACAIAAKALPWDRRSQHDTYLVGYVDGGRDGYARGFIAGQQAAGSSPMGQRP